MTPDVATLVARVREMSPEERADLLYHLCGYCPDVIASTLDWIETERVR